MLENFCAEIFRVNDFPVERCYCIIIILINKMFRVNNFWIDIIIQKIVNTEKMPNLWYVCYGLIVNRPARLKAGQLVQTRQEAGRAGLRVGWLAISTVHARSCTDVNRLLPFGIFLLV